MNLTVKLTFKHSVFLISVNIRWRSRQPSNSDLCNDGEDALHTNGYISVEALMESKENAVDDEKKEIEKMNEKANAKEREI